MRRKYKNAAEAKEATRARGRMYDKKRYPKIREARIIYLREYRKKNKKRLREFDKKRWAVDPKRRAAQKKYYSENPSKYMEIARKHLYRMSPEEYQDRVNKQKNRRALCGRPERMINYHTKKLSTLSVDHNHKTGKNRDLLCMKCNRGIGFFNEDTDLLQKVIQYLEKHKE
jgi:hypothetical protein